MFELKSNVPIKIGKALFLNLKILYQPTTLMAPYFTLIESSPFGLVNYKNDGEGC